MDYGSNFRGHGGGSPGGGYCLSRRYVKKKFIAKSLYGSVWLGLDTITNQEVVIKSSKRILALAKRLPSGASSPEDIKEEIRLHKKLCGEPEPCPYIIKLLDVVWKEDTIDLVLEHAPRGDLFTYIKNKTSNLMEELEEVRGSPEYEQLLKNHWEEVLKLIKQILQAVAYLHARNISHRDLSLENILLGSDGNIKVIDFGNAKEYADTNWLSERGQIGKQGYLTPECAASEFYDGRDKDMWCIGVMLCQMFLGSPLWCKAEASDQRFKYVYFNGLKGLQKLLTVWNMIDRLPPYSSDFLVKIFCPQKCRLTIKEALVHPYITNAPPTDGFVLRNVPLQVSAQQDLDLKRRAHLTRYEHVEIPNSWLKINQEKRQEIINQLSQVNKNITILDRSVLRDVARKAHLGMSDARAIIHYLWASSQYPSHVQFHDHKRMEGNLYVAERKVNLEHRGNDVDIDEDQKCDLSVNQNLDVQPSLPLASCDDTMLEISRERRMAGPSETPVVARSRFVPSKGDRDRGKRDRSPEDVSERRTQYRVGGFSAQMRFSKSGNIQEKSFCTSPRRKGRCFSAGNKLNFNKNQHLVEGDEPRGTHINLHTNRTMRSDREDHCEMVPHRGKKINRSAKVSKPSSRDCIFTLTATAKV